MSELQGTLEIGTNEQGEVVINLDKDRTGHIIFSPRQARALAAALFRQAEEAEKVRHNPPHDRN